MDNFLLTVVDFFRASYDVMYAFTFIVAVSLLLAGLDDFIIDLFYWGMYLFSPKKLNKYDSIPQEDLDGVDEKPIAIFVPAWHEYDVIDKMLTHACSTLQYGKYDIFVGVYPNDPQTIEKVSEVANRFPQVHAVVSSHPGPSTKADNLNDIHQGMLRWENQTGVRYDIIALHDSEDIIHPMSLKVYNYTIPAHDMVQLPVFPLEVDHRKVVQWTYADEFAENHTKDLLIRQRFTGFVPSAGVGTGYNRWLIEFVGTSFARNIFRRASLTEDYDLALRLALGEAKLLFLYRPFDIDAATRAFFPDSFKTAVRQKTRWLIGICLQSWKKIGWVGGLDFRFALYRDRKAVVSNILNALAYIVLLYVILYELARRGLTDYGSLPAIINEGTLLYTIVTIDTVLMLWRFFHRFVTVNRVYGWVAGLLSIPRLPVGNFINFAATVRGIGQFFASRRNNHEVAWDKTAHTFPQIKPEG